MSDHDDEIPPTKRIPHRGDCGKACYTSENAAKRSIRQMQRNNLDRRSDGRLHSYFCKQCRAYHVGHSSDL